MPDETEHSSSTLDAKTATEPILAFYCITATTTIKSGRDSLAHTQARMQLIERLESLVSCYLISSHT